MIFQQCLERVLSDCCQDIRRDEPIDALRDAVADVCKLRPCDLCTEPEMFLADMRPYY